MTRNARNDFIHREDYSTVTGNECEIAVGDLRLRFSYGKLIAIHTGAAWLVSRQEFSSSTTGRHLNKIDGGSDEAKARRLPHDELLEVAGDLISVQRFVTIDGILAGLA